MVRSRPRHLPLAALLWLVSPPAFAELRPPGAPARLEHCGTRTCVVIAGRRVDPQASVSIAGHPVTVHGGRSFRVALPLETLRGWSAPFARSITLRIESPGGVAEHAVRLPIGLLGHITQLASLEISAR